MLVAGAWLCPESHLESAPHPRSWACLSLPLSLSPRAAPPPPLAHGHGLASSSAPAPRGAPCPQLVGMPYLHEVLKPVINRVFEEKRYIELDPCKIDLGRTR